MFKYELGQTVFYMRDNRIHSAAISQRNYNDVVSKEENVKEIKYCLAGGNWYNQSSVFHTIDDLCYYLKMNVKVN